MTDKTLRALAEKATPGPWHSEPYGLSACVFMLDGGGLIAVPGDPYPRDVNHPVENMAFIAACDPQTVAALVRIAQAAVLVTQWRQSQPELALLVRELRAAGLLR